MQTSTPTQPLVVRPSFGLLLKRFVDSNDGRGLGMGLVFAVIGVIVLARSSVPLAVVAGAALAALVVSTAVRLRYEVRPGELRVGNLLRTHVVPIGSLRGIGVQQLEYEAGGLRHRIAVGLDQVDKKGRPVVVYAIATERKKREVVDRMLEDTHRVLASPVEQPPVPPSAPAAPAAAAPGGWHADPHGRHELRYWDGERWTEHVSDAGVTGTD